MDDDISIKRVHLALDAAVCVLGVLLLVPCIIVLEGVPLVVCVEAVLLDQRLDRQRAGGRSEAERFDVTACVNKSLANKLMR